VILFAGTVLDRASETTGAYLPRIGAFLLLILVGYLVAAIAGRIAGKALERLGLDGLANRIGVTRELTAIGIHTPLSRLFGTALRIAILIVAVVAAISALGLTALDASLNAIVLFLPKLFVAVLLVLAGIVVGRYARERVERSATRMDLVGPLGTLTQVALVAIFASTALAELSVSLVILTVIVAIVIASVCFSAALAFGLGSRDTARQIAAGRSFAGSLRVGQTISVMGLEGEIEGFESAAILVRTPEGLARLPNQHLLDHVVTIHD
jgi:small-conductance mechanosensitive channel